MRSPHELDSVIRKTEQIRASLAQLTGRTLFEEIRDARELSRLVFEAPFVLVAHGLGPDPVLDYGNRRALELWEMSWEAFTRTPSRFTAEAPSRAERERLLAAVSERGFIDDYAGVRVSSTGRRFRIERATVFNLADEAGRAAGQAALFEAVTPL